MTLFELAVFAATLDPQDRIEIDGDTMQALWWNDQRLVGVVGLI